LHVAFVDALPRAQQIQLLRVVREDASRTGSRPGPSVRVLASTDVDLADAVADGSFSRELFEIVGVVVVNLPPLRSRREDVPALVEHFVRRFADQLSSRVRSVEASALRRLTEHSWPGNVAALEAVIKRACIVARGDVITNADLGETLGQGRAAGRQGTETALERAARAALHERLDDTAASTESVYHDIVSLVEATLVGEALTITSGNQVKASELLGVNRATLRKKADL
jgi:DNA-binding NtrC family response regulator